ncbi:MAG: hypothetical protein R2861_00070 [Desulfobacterales bacterium]
MKKPGTVLRYIDLQGHGINANSLRALFPTGYLRGACLIAGVGYTETCRPDVPENSRATG